jgi:uncharacterized protein (TIGR03437 family)
MPDSKLLLFSLLTVTAYAAPQLRLSTNTVGPLYVQNGGNTPQPQVINAFNIGDGALNLAFASSSAPWLTATIGQPTTCAGGPVSPCIPITINAAAAGLAVGNYNETVTITDPNAVDAPQTIAVAVQVNGSPTNNIDLYVTPNLGASTAQSDTTAITINTGGTVISTVRTNDGGPWLSFSIVGNQVAYTAYRLRVTSQTGQPEGNYTGTVILSGSIYPSDNRTFNVTMHVTSQPIVQIPTSPITFNLFQGQGLASYNVTFQNVGQGTLQFNGATTSAEWLSALPPRNGSTVTVSANPGSLGPGSYTGTILLLSNAANSSVPIPVRLNVAPAGVAQVAFGGVVDNAAFATGQAVAAGSIAAVFGTQLSSSGPAFAGGFPLPTSLGGVQVLINGVAAPIFYVDPGQVDVQIPSSRGAGQVTVQVARDGQPGNRVSTTIDSLAPRLFALRQFAAAPDGNPFGLVLNSDGTLALPQNIGVPAHPARRGDIVTIYALGLGPTSPSVNTGNPAPSSEPLARLTNSIQVLYGAGNADAVSATPAYAGLAPTFAGLYQINVLIPVNAPTGNVPVSLSMPGHGSNIIVMAIAPQP